MYCPRCGTRAADDARFCFSCGAALPIAQPPPAPAPNPPPAPTPTPAPAPAPAPSATTTLRPGYLASNIGTIEAQEAPPTEYAGFWRRVAAALLDGLILLVAFNVIGFIIGFVVGFAVVVSRTGTAGSAAPLYTPLILGVNGIISLLYYPLQESSIAQATLGKRALGIVVTDTQGRRVSFWRALGRYLAKILSTLIIFIGYVMVAFTARKQGLHDLLAGTLVMRGKPGPRRA